MHRLWIAILIALVSPVIFAQDTSEKSLGDITPISALQVFGGSLDTVDFSPDGSLLASGGRDKAVRIWDVENGANIAVLAGHEDWVTSIRFSPDGTLLASGGRDHTIWLWDTTSWTLKRLIHEHQAEVKSIAFTPDNQFMISGSLDGMVRIEHLDYPTEAQIFQNFGGGVWSMAVSPDGTTLAIGGENSSIWLMGFWDKEQAWVTLLDAHKTPVTTLAWSPDGTHLLSGEQNGHLILWDVEQAKKGETAISSSLLEGHRAPVMGVGFTENENVAISSSLDGTVRLWDVGGEIELAQELSTIQGNGAPLTNLSVSHDRHLSASVGTDGTLSIWSIDNAAIDVLLDSKRPLVIVNDRSNNTLPNPALSTNVNPDSEDVQTVTTSSGPTLSIPSVHMNIGIISFPLDGVSWAIDPWEAQVGHLQGTAWITGTGNMALAGHSLYPDGRVGIFNSLYNVRIGDEIIVQDGDRTRTYIVTDIRTVAYTDVSVVYPTAHNRVTLITCDIPSFVAQTGIYGERLVVIADAVS